MIVVNLGVCVCLGVWLVLYICGEGLVMLVKVWFGWVDS